MIKMKKYILLIFLLVLAVSVSGCTNFLNQNPDQQRIADAETYAKDINASTYNGNGFSFFYPNNWQNYTEPDWLATIGDPNDTSTYIYVDNHKLQSNETVKGLLEKAITEISADKNRNITIVSWENLTVNNNPYEIVVVQEETVEGQLQYMQAWFERNGTAYLLGGVTTPEKFPSMNETFNMFIYSFKFE